MKKLVICLLTALMCFTLFGCGSNKETDTTNAEPTTLTFEISTLFIVPALEATQKVEDEINRYLSEDLGETGYKIHLKVTSIGDYLTSVPMELAGGGEDCPDIYQVVSMASDVENGYCIALDDYLGNELKDTVDLIGNIIGSGKMAGQTYMIPRYFGTVLDWKWIYNKEYAEKAGIDKTQIYDIDTLEEACAKMKETFPDDYFIVYTNQFPNMYRFLTHTSLVGTFGATVGEDPTIVNYYETDAYKDAINKAYEFRQKGYADPEGSNNTASHDTVVMSGASKGVIMGHSADCEGIAKMFTKTNTYGAEFDAVNIGIDDLATDTLGVGISYKCKDPSAAARFINLLYTDEYIWDTLIYGKEGESYVWNDDKTAVNYPEGLDFNTIPYNMIYSCGMIGNGFQTLVFETDSESGSDPEYGKKLMQEAWCPPLYGFTPVTSNILNEFAAVTNVVEQYNTVLIYGDVDPSVEYPKFIAALKEAGIDKIIEEYNNQAKDFS